MGNIFETGLDRGPANFAALTPLGFIERAAGVFPRRTAVIHGARRWTWAEHYARSRRLASALSARGLRYGDTVAALLPNVPAMLEAHFGVPMCGAVLNTLNVRLDAASLAFMLEHGEAKVFLVDREFADVARAAVARCARPPFVVGIDDPEHGGGEPFFGEVEYEAWLAAGDPDFAWEPPADEWNAISLNYTSGTTGQPKGVVYHHRGACLNAVNNLVTWAMPPHPVFLWTLPMFHCNGWCFPWSIAAAAGTHVCLRRFTAEAAFAAIRAHGVTHYCGAPIVHSTLLNAPAALRGGIEHRVHALVAGAAPTAAMIEGMEKIGFALTHVYGLTETYGPATVCAPQGEWDDLTVEERAARNGRQGVRYLLEDEVTVLDPATGAPVPHDGQTTGEIAFRGNIVMKGYLKAPETTAAAFAGGFFRSGDLAVLDPDGYFRITDRSKDIIISGGENISSLEVEDALSRHPAVLAAAVVAAPDARWGEVPFAFVELRPGAAATPEELIEHCRVRLARFKAPKRASLEALPRTSTGKVQKFQLRARAADLAGEGGRAATSPPADAAG